jgi:hypothetical protein
VGFTHERQAAIDAGQHPVQVIAPREEVNHWWQAAKQAIVISPWVTAVKQAFAHSMVNDKGWVQTLSWSSGSRVLASNAS